MEHLQDNLRTYSPLEPLNEEEKEFLEETGFHEIAARIVEALYVDDLHAGNIRGRKGEIAHGCFTVS